MAKIKNLELKIDDKVYNLSINCSTKGVFSCNIPFELISILHLSSKVCGDTLQSVEQIIHEAHSKYINATKTLRLVVALQFKANRQFMKDSEGNVLPAFDNRELIFQSGWGGTTLYSVMAFGYKMLAEESINGHKKYYTLIHENEASHLVMGNEKIGQYYCHCVEHIPSDCEILDYSEALVNNLQSIENQLRNASEFLASLFATKESMQLLTTENIKLLTQK